jgi:hypothetical protein
MLQEAEAGAAFDVTWVSFLPLDARFFFTLCSAFEASSSDEEGEQLINRNSHFTSL